MWQVEGSDTCSCLLHLLLYAISRGNDSTASDLYSYNPLDNTVTMIGSTVHALTYIKFNEADGELYGMTRYELDPGSCNNCLVTLDTTTGAATTVVTLSNASATDNGPHSSMAFLSDGTLHTWEEEGDNFTVVDTSTDVYTLVGSYLDSASHGMCSAASDQILWLNGWGGGDVYRINPSDGARTLLGQNSTTAAAAGWTPPGRYSIRGDCNPDTLFHIGSDIVAGASDGNVVTARLYEDAAPEIIDAWPAPISNLHCIAIER
jgi:hypothetical protein